MPADGEHGGRGDRLALVHGQVEPHPVRVLAVERVPHPLEVRQRARPEVVALGGDLVELLPHRQVVVAALDHLDAGLLGLLDVAAPQLVEVLEDVVERAVLQRDLVDVPRLDVAEARAAVLALLPAHPAQPVGDLEGARLDEGGLDVPQPLDVLVGDARLDRGRVPAADDHRRAHLHGERALLLEVLEHRLQPLVEVGRVPVDHRALGQVGQVPLDLGDLPVENQPDTDQLPGGVVEPAEVLRPPLVLHVGPCRDLAVARRGQALDVGQVLLAADGPQGQAHAGRSPCSRLRAFLARSLLRGGSAAATACAGPRVRRSYQNPPWAMPR